jgi:hypothetical protein
MKNKKSLTSWLLQAAEPSAGAVVGEEFFMPLCTFSPVFGSESSIFKASFWNSERKVFYG